MIPVTLAIDYGRSRVGIALSQVSLAQPLTVLPYSDALFSEISQLLREHAVEQIVVGISEREMARETRAFIEALRKTTDLPIFETDETLSSKTVMRKLRERGKRHIGPIDHFAAAEFLQEWLDTTY